MYGAFFFYNTNNHFSNLQLLTRLIVSYIDVEWPMYCEESPTNMAFTLAGVHQQADTWRQQQLKLVLGLEP